MFRFRSYKKQQIIEDYHHGYPAKKSKRWVVGTLLVLVALLSLTAWYSAQADPVVDGAESRIEAASIEHQNRLYSTRRQWRLKDVKAGQLLTKTNKPGAYYQALLKKSKVHFNVNGMVLNVSLKQSFKNESSEWVEGVYVFPLPEKAAIHRMQIKIGERIIEGGVKEKQAAKRIYQTAKKAGQKASLVEQQRPNMFTTHIANIAPQETVEVHIEYVEGVTYQNGVFGFRFPMTITPRYIPGIPQHRVLENSSVISPDNGEKNGVSSIPALAQSIVSENGLGWAFNTDQVVDASHITPPLTPPFSKGGISEEGTTLDHMKPVSNSIEITADINMAMPLSHLDSAYHSIVLSRKAHRYSLRLQRGEVSMDQDFVLSWQPKAEREPVAAAFTEQIGDHDYALMMVLPESAGAGKILPKEVIYIIDTSGSMGGVSIEQAKKSLQIALSHLRRNDRFNIIAFSSDYTPLYPQAMLANSVNLQQAEQFIRNIRADGGTEMLPALHFSLRGKADESLVRQVIFITDGAVGNEQALFTEIHNNLGASRLFTVGIGSAPNSYYMRKAAEFGRGTFTYIGDIYETNKKMAELFKQLDSPVMTNISIDWPGEESVEFFPEKIPDLYRGQPLVVAADLTHLTEHQKAEGFVVVKGQVAGKPWQRQIRLTLANDKSGVAKMWAREKIGSLLDEKVAGRDENAVKADVLTVALKHQLMSPYTSFVAVDKTPSRPSIDELKTVAVPNTGPKGQNPQSYAYPKTATRGVQSFMIAMLFLVLLAVWRGAFLLSERFTSFGCWLVKEA